MTHISSASAIPRMSPSVTETEAAAPIASPDPPAIRIQSAGGLGT